MTVSTLASIAANLSRVTTAQDSKPTSVLNSLVTTAPITDTTSKIIASDNTTDVSLQSQIAQFRVASQNIAVGNTVLASASSGGADISRELGALHDLAQKASDVPLSTSERAQIDAEFQAIRSRINTIAATTKVGDETPLNGSGQASTSASAAATASAATIGSLTDEALFKGANPNLLTVASSQAALEDVKVAQDYTNKQLDVITSLQGGLDYASSTLQTAIQNQDAAQSTLTDADFETAATGTTTSAVLQANVDVQVAQTTKLPNGLLALLGE